MFISKNYILKEVAGNKIIVPVGAASIDFNSVIHLNDVGAFIFESLQKDNLTLDEIVSLICNEYEVDKDVAYADAKAFCEKLQKCNILEA